MRDRWGAGVLDQVGKAVWAERMAKSMSCGVAVWMIAMGKVVEGSTVWKVEPLADWGAPS